MSTSAASQSKLLQGLNPQQLEAATTLSGPLLILAGAGTGKTRVITVRMAELIRSGIEADRILSVTFTNKAAKEMQQRCSDLLGRRLKKKPVISTFHSLCVKILRQEIEALGYPKTFAIADRGDQESIAREVLRSVRIQEAALRPNDLLNLISRWKSAGIHPERAPDVAETDQEFLAGMAYRHYVQKMRAAASVDFDDLLLLTRKLLYDFPDVLERQRERFDHVQIDEYQDTNGLQFELMDALVQGHRNLCVVGDDDQSIYGWRGAEVKHILSFQSHFPEAKVIRLEENYRCTDRILDLANRLVKNNRDRHDKELRANKSSDVDVRVFDFSDEQLEAERVGMEIDYLVKQKDVPPGDFAILFRTNEQPRIFESELRRLRLPYVLMGTQSFFDVKEIKDLLSYMRAIAYPKDENAMLRIINTPPRGIGSTTVERIITEAVRSGESFWQVAQSPSLQATLPHKAQAALNAFRSLLESYRSRIFANPNRMSQTIEQLVDDIGYRSIVEKLYKTGEQIDARMNMISEFIESIREFEQRGKDVSLSGFLDEVTLSGRDDLTDKEEIASSNAVKLMTLHSAKGLEFPRVYMVGMEEGLLPHKRSVQGSESDIAEERRLCYVGVTRAKDHLTLTYSQTRKKWGKKVKSVPSRFLFEMKRPAD